MSTIMAIKSFIIHALAFILIYVFLRNRERKETIWDLSDRQAYTCNLYYKIFTIVKIVNDTSSLQDEDRDTTSCHLCCKRTFILQASVMMIAFYNRHIFIVTSADLIFVRKARGILLRSVPERTSALVGSDLTCKC
jgi:hypothetical protein